MLKTSDRTENGGSGGIRTLDQWIKSPVLYQLSYRPTPITASSEAAGCCQIGTDAGWGMRDRSRLPEGRASYRNDSLESSKVTRRIRRACGSKSFLAQPAGIALSTGPPVVVRLVAGDGHAEVHAQL
jgi:hypothetical protein